jgi:membrane-bound serine protease (ClpP class)
LPARTSTQRTDENATVAALPVNQELEQLKGRIGRTLSALRPAGVVDFDGRRIDTITEGMMVDPGQWVRCVGTARRLGRPARTPAPGAGAPGPGRRRAG